MNNIEVKIFGKTIGAIGTHNNTTYFEYDKDFQKTSLEISPIKLPLKTTTIYTNNDDLYFNQLAGVFSDSLPDKFGNAIIEEYYRQKGINRYQLTNIQKLAYIGANGMGALEYIPAVQTNAIKEALEISHLVEESRLILQGDIKTTIPEIMEAGGSAGGARAKAIIQYNHNTNHIISGRATPKKGYEHYIVKFDGISPSGESKDYTKIEYIYMQIASMCGLDVASVEILEDRNYLHLLIKRFDRVQNHKIHMHSLCGMTHSNFNQSGAFSYEEYLKTVQIVTQKRDSVIRAYAHMVFNIIASNQDDHTKNFSFLMDSFGQWDISPIYDLTFSHGSGYTSKHQLTINGKQTDFILDDLLKVAKTIEIDTKEAKMIIEYIQTTFYDNFEKLAYDLNVNQDRIKRILSLTRRFDIT